MSDYWNNAVLPDAERAFVVEGRLPVELVSNVTAPEIAQHRHSRVSHFATQVILAAQTPHQNLPQKRVRYLVENAPIKKGP